MEDRFHGGGCSYGDSATLSREHRENSGATFSLSSSSSLCIILARESCSAPRSIRYRGAAATVVVVIIVIVVVVLEKSPSST